MPISPDQAYQDAMQRMSQLTAEKQTFNQWKMNYAFDLEQKANAQADWKFKKLKQMVNNQGGNPFLKVLGGIISGGTSGAATGGMAGGPWGALAGGLAGGALGGIGAGLDDGGAAQGGATNLASSGFGGLMKPQQSSFQLTNPGDDRDENDQLRSQSSLTGLDNIMSPFTNDLKKRSR